DGGSALESGREHLARPVHGQVHVVETTRHADRPAVVSEMPAELTEDGWNGERGEGRPSFRVEPGGGLDQPHHRDLNELLQRFAPSRVPPSELSREPDVLDDEPTRPLLTTDLPLRAVLA